MAKKWLLLLVSVAEEEMPEGLTYTAFPDKLDEAISTVAPGVLDLNSMYLLHQKQKHFIEHVADDTAVNYHHYAVSVRGEKCNEENCEEHLTKNVLSFDDHIKRRRTAPGVN
jgi:hypothetical protein